MQASRRINGARIELCSFDGAGDGEHSGACFATISKIVAMQYSFFSMGRTRLAEL